MICDLNDCDISDLDDFDNESLDVKSETETEDSEVIISQEIGDALASIEDFEILISDLYNVALYENVDDGQDW